MDAKVFARVDTAILAPQRFAEEEMRASQFGTHACSGKPLDRLKVQTVGGPALAQGSP